MKTEPWAADEIGCVEPAKAVTTQCGRKAEIRRAPEPTIGSDV